MAISGLGASLWGLGVDDVLNVTGVEVELADLKQSADTIEIYTNRSEAASGAMLKRDIRIIRKAICWQAAWLLEQPDYHGRQNVNRVNQDGVTVDFGPVSSVEGREYAVTLAPLAARVLKNLSWKRSRSVRIPPASGDFATRTVNPTAFLTDATPYGWRPL